MAYGLPARGQHDWDDELNNSIESLHSDVQSAVSAASGAVSTANTAKSTADAALATASSSGDAAVHASNAAASADSAALSANGAQASAAAAQAAQTGAETAQAAAASIASQSVPKWKSGETVTAGALRVSPLGDIVSAKANHTTGTTYNPANWNLSPTFVVRSGSLSAMPSVAYFGHRGLEDTVPEQTIAAYRAAVAGGADGIECDVQMLADGTPVMMHDPTVDRTTNGTGNVNTFTTPSWLHLNAAAKFPWNGKVENPPYWSQVLDEFGGSVPLFAEPKVANALPLMISGITARGLQNAVCVEVDNLTDLATVKNAGCKAVYWGDLTTSALVSAAVSAGADFFSCPSTYTDAQITTVVASGIRTFVYTVNTRYDRDRFIALGVKGFLSSSPTYLKRDTAMLLRDSWRDGVFGAGLSFTNPTNTTIASGALQLAIQSGNQYAMVGEVSPFAKAATSGSFTIEARFTTLPSVTTTGFGISFLCDRDVPVNHSTASTDPNGYQLNMRADGTMRLLKLTRGTGSSSLGTATNSLALVAGTWVPLSISWTPTSLTITRTDNGGTLTVTDSTYRGGYLLVGKAATDGVAEFRNLNVAP